MRGHGSEDVASVKGIRDAWPPVTVICQSPHGYCRRFPGFQHYIRKDTVIGTHQLLASCLHIESNPVRTNSRIDHANVNCAWREIRNGCAEKIVGVTKV